MSTQVQALNDLVRAESAFVDRLLTETGRVIVGQRIMLERLLIGLMTGGHVLLEGVPGLGKTLTIKTLADALEAQFSRIQFTPDLLPADVIGTQIYSQKTGEFYVRKGPVFANLVLADEINRAPAKVQSALLEAMQERQVTIGEQHYTLPVPFLVLATQNPIEQEGTYPLPEAQVDRFMFNVKVTYPSRHEERAIMDRMGGDEAPKIGKIVDIASIMRVQGIVNQVHIDDQLKEYIVNLVFATRRPEEFGISSLKGLIAYGASPRATIFLLKAAKAHAFLRHRGYVMPEDIKSVGLDVLKHRVILTYEAEAEEITSDEIVKRIFEKVEVP